MGHGPSRGHLTRRKRIRIERDACVGCQLCMRYCPVGDVIRIDGATGKARVVDPVSCGGCYMCLKRCPAGAIKPVVVQVGYADDFTPRPPLAPGQPPKISRNEPTEQP